MIGCPTSPSIVALIPARAGSKRIPGKNTRDFFGHPLIAYTIAAAKASGIFCDVAVSSEDERVWRLCMQYDVEMIQRPAAFATDESPDIQWVQHALSFYTADAFAILRPTSPFRTAETIRRAWREFQEKQPLHSIRAVEPARQSPYKMWEVISSRAMYPFASRSWDANVNPLMPPLHSRPTQTLPTIYAQNASLEMAWTSCVTENCSISGDVIAPFLTEGYEGFDCNTEDDWQQATRLVRDGLVALPTLAPLSPTPAP